MDNVEIAQAFTSALDAGDFDTAASYLAPNFQFSSPTLPQPLGPQEWLGLSHTLKAGFPDLSYNFEVLGGDGDAIRVRSQITGTHTGDLDMSGMGMGVIPATGIAVSAAPEESEGRVEGGKIVSIHLHATPETGLGGVFSQLGIEMG